MRKIAFILLAFIGISNAAYSQKKCNFDFDKDDKVSGSRLQYFDIKLPNHFKARIGNEAGKSFINLVFNVVGDTRDVINPEKDSLYIRLSNKELIKISATDGFIPNAHIEGVQVYSFYAPTYFMTEEQLKSLSENMIIAFKLFINGKEYVVDMEEDKSAKKMMNSFNCMVQSK